MSDPQPTFGRFTDVPGPEPQPRDAYEWLCEAEDALSDARRRTVNRQQMLAWMKRAIDCIEEARKLVA